MRSTFSLAVIILATGASALGFDAPGTSSGDVGTGSGSNGPETVRLLGIVRDFRSIHSDFNTTSVAGWGHCAGLVDTTIGADGRPVLAGAGSGDEGGSTGSSGGSDVLLVVRDASAPDAHDTLRQTLIGGFGFDVTLIDDGATQAEFDAAIAANDVAYVSERITAGTLGVKLVDAGIGVVNEESGLEDEFGFASATLHKSGDTIEITDDSHYITETFGAGTVQILTGAVSSQLIAISGLGSGVDILGREAGGTDTMLAALDTGGMTSGGGAAAGRRVMLPWGRASIDLAGLADDGRTLMRRALQWGAGAESGGTGGGGASTGGAMVSAQWLEDGTDPIAPHLYRDAAGGGTGDVLLVNAPTLQDDPTVDTFNSALGPYGGANVGPAPSFVTGSSMPPVVTPVVLPVINQWKRVSGSTHVITRSVHCSTFEIGNGTTVRIQGNVAIVADELFMVNNASTILLDPGATLEIYAAMSFSVQDESEVNVNTADPSRCRIYLTGTADAYIQDESRVDAQVIAPDTTLDVRSDADFHGSFTGRDLIVQDQAGFHSDIAAGGGAVVDTCGNALDDTAGATGVASGASIASADSFREWFTDVPGVNVSTIHPILLTRSTSGVYEYQNDSFFPIDGELHGDEGAAHNYNFTFTALADFVYESCTGQYLEITGQDDLWVYIGDDLVIDLGGMRANQRQVIRLDRLRGLADGQTYRLALFYAQRQPAAATFGVRTNVVLDSGDVFPAIHDQYD